MSHVESELLAYLDGELSPADTQAVEAHLSRCASCRATLDQLRTLAAGIAETLPAVYESVHLPAEAETRIRNNLAAERARLSRTGSLQQGLAGIWAGLQGAVRPLTKAAIPLMAVVFVVLSLNAARLPLQAGVQQTVVLGQDRLAPGSQAALRVVVRNDENSQPVANANVAVQLRQAGLAKTVYSGSTDATGSAPVQFTVPPDWQGSAELVVDTASELGDDQVVAPILLERSYRLLLGSDKPVYQPGETLHLRTLALGKVDSKPADGTRVRFEVFDPNGQQLLAEEKTTSAFGIASFDLPLAPDAALGQYQVRATLGDTVSELSVTLGQAPLPKFRVDVLADAPYTLTGDRLTGRVDASYFYGKPLAGAPVSLRLVGSRLAADAPDSEERVFVQEQSGETGSDGRFVFQFDLPELPADAFAEDDTILLALEATVTDAAGDSEFGWQRITMASQPILIDVVPEDGVLHTGVENILYVLTSYPDGQPAPTSLQVQIGSAAKFDQVTNAYGLAEVRFTPRSGAVGDRQVSVTAADAAGHVGTTIVVLPLDEATETLLLRTDRALYQVGDTLAAETIATGSGEAVYVDVIKGGQTLLTTSSLVKNGKSTLGIDLTPELAGTLELNAYQVTGDDAILRDSRAVVVDSPEDLQVAITTDEPEYRPGDQAQIAVQTSRSGEGVESAVGLSVVNEAVFAQREYQPGFARAYFLLDKALQESGLSLPDASTASADAQARGAREAQQLTAKASWAGYGGQDYSLAERSVDETSRNEVNDRRQQAFSRLSLLISLALILASVTVAIVVVNGLRRTGVLGQAASRLLLTVIVFAVAGAALLFLTQSLLNTLPEHLSGIALAATALLWIVLLLALLFYGMRTRDQRVQYVALWLFAYAVLLAVLAFAASQGATLASIWLMLLAGSFGLLLAVLLLFGWGLRAEGAKAAGLVALLLALLVLPLVVELNAIDLSGSDVIEKITGPSVYGLNGGILVGCAAPAAAPQPPDQAAERQELQQAAPAAAPEAESAGGVAAVPSVSIVQEDIAASEESQAGIQPSPAAETPAAESPQAAAVSEEMPQQPVPSTQPVVAAEVLALSATTGTAATTISSTVILTPTQEMTAPLELASAATVSETVEVEAMAASAPVTTSAAALESSGENRLIATATPIPTTTVTLTATQVSGIEARKVAAASATTTSTLTARSAEVITAALAASATSRAESPVATPTPEPVTPSPALPPESIATSTPQASPTSTPALAATSTPALVAPWTPEPPPAAPVDTPVPIPEPTPTPAAAPSAAAALAPEVRVKQLPRPTSVPLEALPIIRERFPQTLYWNPEVITDAGGRVQVDIPTGDAITTWRITAQAVDRSGKLGSSSAPLIVFQPLFLVPNVPTELLLGQEAVGQVQIFNYSSQAQTAMLRSQSTPGLELSQPESSVTVGPNDVVSVSVLIRAIQTGPQAITWVVVSDVTQDARQVTITVK